MCCHNISDVAYALLRHYTANLKHYGCKFTKFSAYSRF